MTAIKAIKLRIRSTKNTSQITKAMEVVSATKMRRAQQSALAARPFAVAMLQMIHNLLLRSPYRPPLLTPRPVTKIMLILVTSDKGLAGAFNAGVLRKAESWMREQEQRAIPYMIITVGKKAREFCARKKIVPIASFVSFGDFRHLEDTLPIADRIIDGFRRDEWDEVYAIYTNFRTTLVQDAIIKKILPATEESITETVKSILPERGRFAYLTEYKKAYTYNYEYKIEPSPDALLEKLADDSVRVHVHHLILESNASEHSARMIAMKNASENAKELIGGLTQLYNKARQSAITQELTEITGGREALESM